MHDEQRSGFGGGVRIGHVPAATFGGWTLATIGPSLYKLEATLTWQVPPWLVVGHFTVWIDIGPIRWEWTTDEIAVDGAAFVALVNTPKIGPVGG